MALKRFCLTTKRWTPASSHASTMRSPSFQRVAIGFSVMTWTPASAVSIVWRGCMPLGVQTATMSGSACPSMSGRRS